MLTLAPAVGLRFLNRMLIGRPIRDAIRRINLTSGQTAQQLATLPHPDPATHFAEDPQDDGLFADVRTGRL